MLPLGVTELMMMIARGDENIKKWKIFVQFMFMKLVEISTQKIYMSRPIKGNMQETP